MCSGRQAQALKHRHWLDQKLRHLVTNESFPLDLDLVDANFNLACCLPNLSGPFIYTSIKGVLRKDQGFEDLKSGRSELIALLKSNKEHIPRRG